MPFSLKDKGATCQRLVSHIFNKQIDRNVEVYVDNMLVKSKEAKSHLDNLQKTFNTLRRYQMKLNPAKYVFGVFSKKFLGFLVSQRGIEVNQKRFVSKATNKCLPFSKTFKQVFQ